MDSKARLEIVGHELLRLFSMCHCKMKLAQERYPVTMTTVWDRERGMAEDNRSTTVRHDERGMAEHNKSTNNRAVIRWQLDPIDTRVQTRLYHRRSAMQKQHRRSTLIAMLLSTLLNSATIPLLECYALSVAPKVPSARRAQITTILARLDETEDRQTADDEFHFGDSGGFSGIVLEDLLWRVEKLRLEEQNRKRFLKARARFLPYEDCRRWVQAWGKRWKTAMDWNDWIAMGEKKNPYIPSRPDEYYGRLGQWISWDHFLLIPPEVEESE